jgi:FkbM family methyltransferase
MSFTNLSRKYGLKLLKYFERDISIQHHWVPGQKIRLNSFRHKGFWYHGRNRERETMLFFKSCISKGDTVVEVGGHIGYISSFFSSLVGPDGKVIVFEPGSNNLRYIRDNLKECSNVVLIEKGAGSNYNTLNFYEDSLTGQNNSFLEDFDGLIKNQKAAFTTASIVNRQVDVVPVDSVTGNLNVSFMKIDVEGFELSVLQGSLQTLAKHPIIMVEVQADNAEIFTLLSLIGYQLFTEFGTRCETASQLSGNIFCLHTLKHKNFLSSGSFIGSTNDSHGCT